MDINKLGLLLEKEELKSYLTDLDNRPLYVVMNEDYLEGEFVRCNPWIINDSSGWQTVREMRKHTIFDSSFDRTFETRKFYYNNPKELLGRWIPCKERLPDVDEDVLICSTTAIDFVPREAYLQSDGNFFDGRYVIEIDIHEITHWLPFPEIPPYRKGE